MDARWKWWNVHPRTNPATCDLKRERIEHWFRRRPMFGRVKNCCTARTGAAASVA